MSTLRYSGPPSRCGNLREGVCVDVPTNWDTDSSGRVSEKAMGEIIPALIRKGINIDDISFCDTFDEFISLKGFKKRLKFWTEVR